VFDTSLCIYTFVKHFGVENIKFSDKFCRESQNTHFMFNIFFLISDLCEIIRKNNVQRSRPHTRMWRMRLSLYVAKATITHSQYVILIHFPNFP